MSKAPLGALVLGLALLAGLAAWAWRERDDVPIRETRARAAWDEVLRQYGERARAVPPLLDALRRLAPAERELWDAVGLAQLRVSAVATEQATLDDRERFRAYAGAEARLSRELGRVYETIERYPEVRADSAFMARLNQFRALEDRVVVSRGDFIAAARRHNEELRTVPDRWIAAFFHPKARPFAAFGRPQLDREGTPALNEES